MSDKIIIIINKAGGSQSVSDEVHAPSHLEKSSYVVSVNAFILFILYVKPIISLLIQRIPARSSIVRGCLLKYFVPLQRHKACNNTSKQCILSRTLNHLKLPAHTAGELITSDFCSRNDCNISNPSPSPMSFCQLCQTDV